VYGQQAVLVPSPTTGIYQRKKKEFIKCLFKKVPLLVKKHDNYFNDIILRLCLVSVAFTAANHAKFFSLFSICTWVDIIDRVRNSQATTKNAVIFYLRSVLQY